VASGLAARPEGRWRNFYCKSIMCIVNCLNGAGVAEEVNDLLTHTEQEFLA